MSVREYKCPCCGAALRYNLSNTLLSCESCGNSFEINAVQQYEAEMDSAINNPDNFGWSNDGFEEMSDDESSHMKIYICPSCGGEIICDENTAATKCPYCDNNTILEDRLSGQLKPKYVIPFKVDKDEAVKKLKEFCNGKKLLPDEFTRNNHIEDVTGIYVPYWLFDCNADGRASYRATNSHTWRSGDYVYTKTDHYLVSRAGTMQFDKVPVDGSKRMADNYMEAIEPYDYSALVDYNSAYLSGFMADKYDVTKEEGQPRANERIKTSIVGALRSTVGGYSTVSLNHAGVNFDNGLINYALLPVWVLNTKFDGKIYTFMMNGQTGKFVGELPFSKKKLRIWRWGLFAVWSIILIMLFTLLF